MTGAIPTAAALPHSEDSLLLAVNAAGARFERLVFTRNRRVLVSVGDRGRTLRVHACFGDAPPDVVRGLAAIYGSGGARDRGHARSLVRAYLDSRRSELARDPTLPRSRRIPAADREHVERLRAEFDRVNHEHFDGELPRVHIALSGRMRRRNGHFSPWPLEIVVARRLCTHAAAGEAEHTLRHEMIHLWQHASGAPVGHRADFRGWARRLGVHPRASRPVRQALR